MIENLNAILGGGAVAIAGAVALWLKVSRARATTSQDTLQVMENTSQGDWLRRLEERFEQERQRADAAMARERAIHAELQEAKSRLREADLTAQLLRERNRRLERRVNRLVDMVARDHPEMRTWMVTEPAPMDEGRG